MLKNLLACLMAGVSVLGCFPGGLRREPAPRPGPAGARLAAVARRFMGRPYLTGHAGAAADADERVRLRFDAFDCVTLVETSLAVMRAERDPQRGDPVVELEALRYRGGRCAGYSSRLHYFSDWIRDNAARGRLVDLTPALGGIPDPRPINFMTAHPDRYPALADAQVLQDLKAAEASLSAAPRTYLPKEKVAAVAGRIQEGDILAFTTTLPGLDVSHAGLACRGADGILRLLHASSSGGTIQVSRLPLVDYLQNNPGMSGILVARPI